MIKKRWTKDEVIFLQENKDKGIDFLIENMKRDKNSIYHKARKLDIIFPFEKMKITKEVIESVIQNCYSYSDVCRALNKKPAGGMYELIKNRINEFNIDIKHFNFKRIKNNRINNKKTPEDVLTIGRKNRENHKILKRILLEVGFKYCCSECGIEEWNNKPITLDIDHINGDWTDNRKENLRFLCPNCHRQTNTFGFKNTKKPLYKQSNELINAKKFLRRRKINFQNLTDNEILDLKNNSTIKRKERTKKEKTKKEKRTFIDYTISRRKTERPTYDVLINDVNTLGYLATGRKYGVSDNAIRKWVKFYLKHTT